MRRLLLLRPEPGLTRSAEAARAVGLDPILAPQFRIVPVDWEAPDPKDFDGLLLTSANAARFAGPQLETLAQLPVHAVGASSAEAARKMGLDVVTVGEGSINDLLERIDGKLRILHLAGEDRRPIPAGRNIRQLIVYRAEAIDDDELPPLSGLVVAVHSPRSGERLAQLGQNRNGAIIAAISAEAAAACGAGWEQVCIAERPNDESLLALAASLCQTV